MSLNLEVEVDVPFTFDYEALAGEVVAFTIDHEGFPYEAEVNLTLTDDGGRGSHGAEAETDSGGDEHLA